MLNVTKVYDQPGWAYDFIAREMAKYSQCKIKSQAWNNIDYTNQDIVIISGPNIDYKTSAIQIPQTCKAKGIKVIGQYCGEVDMVYAHADLIVTISPQLYLYAKNKYKDIPVIFLPESVDTNYFEPSDREIRRFTPGWAGGANKAIKRTRLFEKLGYSVKIMSQHGKEHFKVGRMQDDMKEFYKDIDCFICMSETECMPRVILEAMASGLPVISTDVGGIHLLIPDEYIIPVYPEEEAVKQMKAKLDLLREDVHLRDGLGRINRAWCEKLWSWENNMPIWDEVFYHLKEGNIKKILEINDDFVNGPFKKYFTMNDQYKKHIAHFNKERIVLRPQLEKNKYEAKIEDLIYDLQEFRGDYWMAWASCLDTVNTQRIVSHPGKLYFGVKDVAHQDNFIAFLKNKGMRFNGHIAKWNDLEISVLIEDQIVTTKEMTLYGQPVKVPFPVVPYLSAKFGNDWRNK